MATASAGKSRSGRWVVLASERIPAAKDSAARTRVETGAHFETGDATLSEQDKPLLDDFAKVIRGSHSDAVVAMEGFADPAGSVAFNRRLGQRRAEAIRDYLTANGGLAASQVRAAMAKTRTGRCGRVRQARKVATIAASRW